jgi:hypothetical protein
MLLAIVEGRWPIMFADIAIRRAGARGSRHRDPDHCGSSAGLMSRGRLHRSGVGKCATVQWSTSCGSFCANSFRAFLPRRVRNGIFGAGDRRAKCGFESCCR